MNTLLQDLRYALRTLRRSPGFTIVAVLTLALGIGANTAIFSMVDPILLRPLPYAEPERLVVLGDRQPTEYHLPASLPEFMEWRDQSRTVEQVSAIFERAMSYTGGSTPEQVEVAMVAEGYFDLFGVRPLAGRGLAAEDHREGAPPAAVLSYGFWQRMGGDHAVIGSTLPLDGRLYTVLGVMPSNAPSVGESVAAWIALEPSAPWRERGTHYLRVLGRLRPGVSFDAARAELAELGQRLGEQHGTGHGITLTRLRDDLFGDLRPAMLILFGAVGFVLLIALANVAGLVQARMLGRTHEFAVRSALGANRTRLIRLALAESLLLAAIGGTVGSLLALWGTEILASLSSTFVPFGGQIRVDGRALAFTLLLTLGVGVLLGLAPAWQHSRAGLAASLRGTRGTSTRLGVRSLLTTAEIALALLLLVGAGLTVRSFVRLAQVDPGFEAENSLTLRVALPAARYAEGWRQSDFFQALLERVAHLPGVERVAAARKLPLAAGGPMTGDFQIEGRPPFPAEEAPAAEINMVSAGYFETMRVQLVSGRTFTAEDRAGARNVVIINETMARRYWPDEDPIGKRISIYTGQGWQEIVGVVRDVKVEGLNGGPALQTYLPYLQTPVSGMSLVVRTHDDPTALAAAVRAEVAALDSELPVTSVRTLEQVSSSSIRQQRLPAVALGTFAALALLLAAIGVYGVLAHLVCQRTHEIGIRMALGAAPGDVLRTVLGQGMRMAALGIAIGTLGALAAGRLLAGLLFGVRATDPVTFVGGAAALALVALLACWIPARRAMRVDPQVALRGE